MPSRDSSEKKFSHIDEFSELVLKNSTRLNAEQKLSLLAQNRTILIDAEVPLVKSASQRLKRFLELPLVCRSLLRSLPPLLLLTALLIAIPHIFITGKLNDTDSFRYSFVDFVGEYQGAKADDQLHKNLTPYEEQILSRDSKSLYEKHPNDILYLSDYLLNHSTTAPLELFDIACELDPNNAWLTAFYAGVLNDRGHSREARHRLHDAAKQTKYHRHPSELHRQRVKLHQDFSLGSDINRHAAIEYSMKADFKLIRRLCRDATTYTRTLVVKSEDSEIELLGQSICSLLQKMAATEGSLDETTALADAVDYNVNRLKDSARLAKLPHLEKRWDLDKIAASKHHDSISWQYSSQPEYSFDSFRDGTQRVETSASDRKPGNWKYFLAMEGTYASVISTLILPLSLLTLAASFFGSFTNKTLAFSLQPLFSPLKLFVCFFSSLAAPLFIYFIVTRWTPLGCRHISVNHLSGQPLVGQLHLCLLLIITTTITLSGSLVRNTLQLIAVSKGPSLLTWLPVFFLVAALARHGFFPLLGTKSPSTDELVSVALGLLVVQFLLSLTGHGNTPVARILTCRLTCTSLALSSITLLALLPAFSWRESYWSERDSFNRVQNSSIYTTEIEANFTRMLQRNIQEELSKIPVE